MMKFSFVLELDGFVLCKKAAKLSTMARRIIVSRLKIEKDFCLEIRLGST